MINLSFHNDEACYSIDETKAPGDRSSATDQPPAELPNGLPKQPAPAEKKVSDDVQKIYDPYDYGNTEHATTFWGTVGHIVVISFGPTLLSIPQTFINAGYVIGFVCSIITVTLYAHCMRMIICCEYELCKRIKKPNITYIEMVREAFSCGPVQIQWFSKYIEIIIYFMFLCIWIGGNSILFLLIGDIMKNACDYFFETDVSGNMLTLYLVVPLVLLCWIPNLKWLVPLSAITNSINIVSICVIMYHVLTDMPPLAERKPFGHWTSVPLLMGVQLFSINATSLMIPLKSEMKRPKKFNSTFGVITASYVPVCLMYSFFGLLCYLKYGENSLEIIILNLPSTPFNKAIIGLYSIGIVCLFPLFSYVSYDIIWNNLLKDSIQKSEYKFFYDYMCRTSIALSSMFCAYTVPNLTLFLSLTGTVGTSIDSLIVPALAEMLIYYKQRTYFLYFKNSVIIVLALMLIVMGSANCITQLIKTFS